MGLSLANSLEHLREAYRQAGVGLEIILTRQNGVPIGPLSGKGGTTINGKTPDQTAMRKRGAIPARLTGFECLSPRERASGQTPDCRSGERHSLAERAGRNTQEEAFFLRRWPRRAPQCYAWLKNAGSGS